jgi:uncharacterized coiled-coil protein SlyX
MNAYKRLESAIKVGQETIDKLRAENDALQDRIRELESRLTQACTRTVGTCPPHTVSPNGEYCIDCGIVLLPPAGKA